MLQTPTDLITPLWPQANAEAERFMRNLGKVIRSALVEGKSWRQELHVLLRNYRATPHSSTGIAPATALFNREMRIKLPNTMAPSSPPRMQAKLKTNDKQAKRKMKMHADEKRHTSILSSGICNHCIQYIIKVNYSDS